MDSKTRLLEAAKALSTQFGTNRNLTEAMQELDAAIQEAEQAPTKQQDRLNKRFVQRAHEMYHVEGEVEVDVDHDTAEQRAEAVSASEPVDGGAYVKAWVWVPLEEVKTSRKAG